MEGMLALLALFLLLGCVFGWVSLLKIRGLSEDVRGLKEQLSQFLNQGAGTGSMEANANRKEAPPLPSTLPDFAGHSTSTVTHSPASSASNPSSSMPSTVASGDSRQAKPFAASNPSPENSQQPKSLWNTDPKPAWEWPEKVATHLQEHWMIWLGGVCVALAGIFMVRYSIETGLLGPWGRVSLALVTGILLHIAADGFRRRLGSQPAFAALAGGASITLYAGLLAAMHLYQLISPGMVFILLAIVSMLTMMLAIQHGPVLAILGILGAYVVPILVSTGSGNILAALVYSLIVTVSALLLMQRVYRPWLWFGTLAGAIAWWALSLTTDGVGGNVIGLRSVYLTAVAYAFLALPQFDWLLSKPLSIAKTAAMKKTAMEEGRQAPSRFIDAPLFIGLLIILAAQAFTLLVEGFSSSPLLASLPLTLLIFVAAGKDRRLAPLGWFSLMAQLSAWFAVAAIQQGGAQWPSQWPLRLPEAEQLVFLRYAAIMAVVYFCLSAWHLRQTASSANSDSENVNSERTTKALWASLMFLSPLLWLAASHLLTGQLAMSWQWSVVAALFGLAYLSVSGQRLRAGNSGITTIWLILAGHLAYSLAAAILLREASLTLAIAAQAFSLAWVIRRFNVQSLGWLLKLVLAVVVVRLTLNPWLLSYPADIHWSLWTYGGSTLFCAAAAWVLRQNTAKQNNVLRVWLEAVTLHLLVLTMWAEARYWLYGGNIFEPHYGFTEAALNTNAWAALGLAYFWRARVSQTLVAFYRFAGSGLLAAALLNYFLTVLPLNPFWGSLEASSVVATTPVFNLLLLAYGLPVLLSIAVAKDQYVTGSAKKIAILFTGFSAFVFINTEIRHLWHGLLNYRQPMLEAELYSYSIVWLVIAIVILLASSSDVVRNYLQNGSHTIYKLGIAILGCVIAKIFLVDMAGLEGLLRVASFMGLGLSLLGLGYLLKRGAKPDDGPNHSPDDSPDIGQTAL